MPPKARQMSKRRVSRAGAKPWKDPSLKETGSLLILKLVLLGSSVPQF